MFDLIPLVLLVYLITFLITKNVGLEKVKYIFFRNFYIVCVKRGVLLSFSTKIAHEKACGKLTKLRLHIINHLRKLSLGFCKEHNTSELTTIMQYDVE